MAGKRDFTAVYVILGRAHVAAESYDAKGAFILLHRIEQGLDDAAPSALRFVCHLHMVAALGEDKQASREARLAMIRLISALESAIPLEPRIA